MGIKKGDFVSVNYTGMTLEGQVFDTTKEDIAKKHAVNANRGSFGPVTICVGEGHILPGLDSKIEGKDVGASFEVTLGPEEAFGKKNAKLIQLISANKFKQAKMNPQVGMQVTVDERPGIIRKSGGGRVLVDFNHPLAGMEVKYAIEVKEAVTDAGKKLQALMELQFPNIECSAADGKGTITFPVELPPELQQAIKDVVTRLIPEIKSVDFVVKEPETEAKT